MVYRWIRQHGIRGADAEFAPDGSSVCIRLMVISCASLASRLRSRDEPGLRSARSGRQRPGQLRGRAGVGTWLGGPAGLLLRRHCGRYPDRPRRRPELLLPAAVVAALCHRRDQHLERWLRPAVGQREAGRRGRLDHVAEVAATVDVPAQTAKAPGRSSSRSPSGCRSTPHPVTTSAASSPRFGRRARTRRPERRSSSSATAPGCSSGSPGHLAPKLTLTDLHATYHGALNPVGKRQRHRELPVTNAGNVELGVSQGVSVTGLFGGSQHVAVASEPLLLPGDSMQETAQLGRGVAAVRGEGEGHRAPGRSRRRHRPAARGGDGKHPAVGVAVAARRSVVVVLAAVGGGIVRALAPGEPVRTAGRLRERVNA